MNKQEKVLFFSLCKLKHSDAKEEKLKYATPCVLGHLFFNRMAGIGYEVLRKKELLDKTTREFRNALKLAYDCNIEKNESYSQCLQHLFDIFSKSSCEYAMLKGAVLCHTYPSGCRTSNDIDILVRPEQIDHIGEQLLQNGFSQGKIRNGEFIPSERKEIIESKMLRGETVPYIKQVDLKGMKYLEVDINYSLDYKNANDNVVGALLKNRIVKDFGNHVVYTLSDVDFMIHLCAHLYKEATTLPWIEMGRDMSLYKYHDIVFLLDKMEKSDIDSLFLRAKELNLDRICAFSILQSCFLFDCEDAYVYYKAFKTIVNDSDFLHRVISPKDKKVYVYGEKNIKTRFFSNNRKAMLKEVK